MSNSTSISIIPNTGLTPREMENSIVSINAPLAELLTHVGLPVSGILAPVEERRKIIQSLESVLEILDIDDKIKADYLSKFAICITMGLFDGALAYLWDQTIRAIREKIISFDLSYFYSIATSISSKYRGLHDPKDIEAISEFDLLEISRRIGLLDDVNHRRLEQVNYFRNHASSAHPNNITLTGIELLSFLENCLKHAICAKFDDSVIHVKRLLENVRTKVIPSTDFAAITSEIRRLPNERIEDLFKALIGYYTDLSIAQTTINNIEGLISEIWKSISNDTRYKIGAKFGYYRANGDIDRKNRIQNVLNIVNGNEYKDLDSLAQELIEKIQLLRSAHFGLNNFYNEYPHAQAVAQSLPTSGIPKAARNDFVKITCMCFMGNGLGYREGVDEGALPLYQKFIDRFGDEDIQIFLNLFLDHEFVGDLSREKVRTRCKALISMLRTKTSNPHFQSAFDLIERTRHIESIGSITQYKQILKNMS